MPTNNDKHYVVKYRAFKPTRDEHIWEYAPDGETYECTREQAEARFAVLLLCGRMKLPVCGLVPFHVRIEDTRIPEPKGREPMQNVMLSQYVPDDYALGPWTNNRIAA